jgi:hypothetical protein
MNFKLNKKKIWGIFVISFIGSIIASYLINSTLKKKIIIESGEGLAALNPVSIGLMPLIFFGVFIGIVVFVYVVWSFFND